MWLVVGLGNPGTKYASTRHNIGFLALDELAGRYNLTFRDKTDYRICDGSVEGSRTFFLEPLTFMNLSGRAVRAVTGKNNILPENIIVVHDDLDLETGRLKIRKKGTSGGHKGIESIIQHLGTRDFIRVKIGIGRDPFIPTEEYVLSKFRKNELPEIREAVIEAADAVLCIIKEGADKAMNKFN
ncbi:MAG: aminoacyl-tRNA hydrolase [Nitrospirae bacterium]|nr:aminoacyl-tRNA hydrolase [Nitrospirota bacterium]